MTNPYATPVPPAPRPPDTRPLHKRVLVWVGGAALLITGTLIGSIMRRSSGRLAGLAMSADVKTLVGQADGVHLQVLADQGGLTGELSHAVRRKGFIPLLPRGQVL